MEQTASHDALNPRFQAHVDHAVRMLRERLLADVLATAEREKLSPGIRRDWCELVRRLAKLRNEPVPPAAHTVQTPARTSESN